MAKQSFTAAFEAAARRKGLVKLRSVLGETKGTLNGLLPHIDALFAAGPENPPVLTDRDHAMIVAYRTLERVRDFLASRDAS